MEFKTIRLGEITTINMGQSPKGNTYNTTNKGIPFLQGNRTFGVMYPIIDTWTTDPKKIGHKDSVLMSVRAPVGALNIANQDVCIGRGLCSIEMKNKNNKYLYYLLKNSLNDIKNKSTGTVFDSINRIELENIEILNYDISTQNKIEKVLSSLDSKINNNNQTNNNLSEISQNLYKRWFINFEF
ncbi:MAG: restriction endonuclease subunit S, partial [Bacilli bacterium]